MADDKETMEQKIDRLKAEFDATQSAFAARKTENEKLMQEITELNEKCVKMSTISNRNRQLSTESESASEILSTIPSPKRFKLVRQPNVDASDVKELILPTFISTPNVVAITSKDVTSVLPKYSTGHITASLTMQDAQNRCQKPTRNLPSE